MVQPRRECERSRNSTASVRRRRTTFEWLTGRTRARSWKKASRERALAFSSKSRAIRKRNLPYPAEDLCWMVFRKR